MSKIHLISSWQPHYQSTSTKISQKWKKKTFSPQNVIVSYFKVKIRNHHLKIDLCIKFQLNWTKTRTRTKKGRILGLSVRKLEYDVMLTSQSVISSWILFSAVDFTHFYLCAKFQHPRFTNKGKSWGNTPQTYTLIEDPSPNRVKLFHCITSVKNSK